MASWQAREQRAMPSPAMIFKGALEHQLGAKFVHTEIVQNPNGKMTKHVVKIVHFSDYWFKMCQRHSQRPHSHLSHLPRRTLARSWKKGGGKGGGGARLSVGLCPSPPGEHGPARHCLLNTCQYRKFKHNGCNYNSTKFVKVCNQIIITLYQWFLRNFVNKTNILK